MITDEMMDKAMKYYQRESQEIDAHASQKSQEEKFVKGLLVAAIGDTPVTRMKTTEVVARTLEQVSNWGSIPSIELSELATNIRRLDGVMNDVCPMCEEVQCDSNCPLSEERSI